MHIKKDDNVIVLSGTDKGKTGKVLKAFPQEWMILVEGINVKKRHQRPTQQGKKGVVIDKSFPIHVSNVKKVEGTTTAKPKKAAKPKAK